MKHIILVAVFVLMACANQQKLIEQKKIELQPIDSAPSEIAIASESVFLLLLADRPHVFDLSTPKKINEFYNNQNPPLVRLENIIVDFQVESCKKLKKMKNCPVSREVISATSFVLNNSKHLYTNYHPFFEYIRDVLGIDLSRPDSTKELKKLTLSQLPIFLFNNKGELILTPISHRANISNTSVMNLFAKTKEKLLFEYDFIEIELDSNILGVVPLKSADVIDHELIYLLGFPEKGPNISLLFSQGSHLPYIEAANQLHLKPLAELSVEGLKLATKSALYYSGPSVNGMSGGPYLNRDGKVVGIHRGTRKAVDTVEISVGVKSSFIFNFDYPISSNKK